MRPTTTSNAAAADPSPAVSVTIPFYRSDPTPLVRALAPAAARLEGAVEFVLADDGGGDEDLLRRVRATLSALKTPATLLAFPQNQGRAGVRNRLAEAARGGHLLLLDCDMAPQDPAFLDRWLERALAGDEVVFGGFLVPPLGPSDRRFRFHHALQTAGEALTAAERAKDPAKYVFTSNLLVRRALLLAEPFDEAFRGWGWEDVDFGLRIAARARIDHIDNPALHLGLDEADAVLRKYDQSTANFIRMLDKNPEAVSRYALVKAAARIARLPASAAITAVCGWFARAEGPPTAARVLAAKLYRASLYAPAMRARLKAPAPEGDGRPARQDQSGHTSAGLAKP